MTKLSDVIRASHEITVDQITAAQWNQLLAMLQDAIESHDHSSDGGSESGTGDGAFLSTITLQDGSELTIATGAITATGSYHRVDTESDAASDDLDTITATGLSSGHVLLLRAANDARTVTVKHGTGNVRLAGGADFALDAVRDTLLLLWDGDDSEWVEVSRASNS